MKKIILNVVLLTWYIDSFCQNFDRNYQLNSTNCCSVQWAGMDFIHVDKNGNFYSLSYNSSQGYPPGPTFKCYRNNGTTWSLGWMNIYAQNFTDVQPDNSGNVICSGFTNSGIFYFNSAHTVSYANGNFYVKFDSIGNPQWAVQRRGSFHVMDKSGGFVSVKTDSTFKYNANGTIIWQKPQGAKNSAAGSYNNDFYYLLDSTTLSKCDTAGNIIWTNTTYTGTKLVADSMENIYIRSGNNIYKLDSAGNFIYSRTYSSLVDYTIDKAGNIYILLIRNVQKYDSSGLNQLWNYYSTAVVENQKIGVDRNYHVFYALRYGDWTGAGIPNPIFLPPGFLHDYSSLPTFIGIWAARISQDAGSNLNSISAPVVPLNNLLNLCEENPFNVSFTINSYPVTLPFNPLFKVQLSNSAGSFSNPLVIGQGNTTKITCTIPSFVSKGNQYRIRVVLSNLSVISPLNVSGPIRIRKAPNAELTVTGYGSPNYGCTDTPLLLHANTNPDFNYQFYYWVSPGSGAGYHAISGATDSVYAVNSTQNFFYYAVRITKSSTGCFAMSDTVKTLFFPAPSATITPQGPTTFCAGDSAVLAANTGSGLTYQWKKGGTDISAATSVNYAATTGGVYKVKVLNTFGCSKLSTGVLVSVPCRDEEELNEISGSISIFPNPSSGKFTIQTSAEKISQIIITDLSGQIVFKKGFQNNFNSEIEIDLRNQSIGIYFIQLITERESFTHKIILN